MQPAYSRSRHCSDDSREEQCRKRSAKATEGEMRCWHRPDRTCMAELVSHCWAQAVRHRVRCSPPPTHQGRNRGGDATAVELSLGSCTAKAEARSLLSTSLQHQRVLQRSPSPVVLAFITGAVTAITAHSAMHRPRFVRLPATATAAVLTRNVSPEVYMSASTESCFAHLRWCLNA